MELVDQFDARQIEKNVKDHLKGQNVSELISKSPDKKKWVYVYLGTANYEWQTSCRSLAWKSFQRFMV